MSGCVPRSVTNHSWHITMDCFACFGLSGVSSGACAIC
ncbi:hypothetical protein WN943_000890 [Citrus x changshan-huyou]